MPAMKLKLPLPSPYGSYWLNEDVKHRLDGPAIFPSKQVVPSGRKGENDKLVNTNKYIVFMGSDLGFIFEGAKLARYDTPEEALLELRKRVRL